MPSLKSRQEDIHLMFRKFASDFSSKHNMPTIRLTEKAINLIEKYNWPGNIRELKNFTEKISIIEEKRILDESDINLHLSSNHKRPSLRKEYLANGKYHRLQQKFPLLL